MHAVRVHACASAMGKITALCLLLQPRRLNRARAPKDETGIHIHSASCLRAKTCFGGCCVPIMSQNILLYKPLHTILYSNPYFLQTIARVLPWEPLLSPCSRWPDIDELGQLARKIRGPTVFYCTFKAIREVQRWETQKATCTHRLLGGAASMDKSVDRSQASVYFFKFLSYCDRNSTSIGARLLLSSAGSW